MNATQNATEVAALIKTLVLVLGLWSAQTALAAEPLTDPIPVKIPPGEIIVAAEDFVRLPQTKDSSTNLTNDAYARIQYMVPFGHTLGPLIINDTRGVLYRTDMSGPPPTVYLDLREQNIGFDDSMFPNEMGLASVAFHPEFTSIGKPGFGKFYTAYSARSDSGTANYLDDDAGSHESVIRQWTAFNPRAPVFEGTSREIFRVGQFAPNHNIGTLGFNPIAEVGSTDYGVLYATLGDGGVANDPRQYGQSLAEPLSTIIRINPLGQSSLKSSNRAYAIPADNPFIDRIDSGIAPEIWVYGLRHAQHFSWDNTGRMFINDIGQNQIEEVNIGVAGANYGWRLREGTFATAFAVQSGEPGLVYPLSDLDDGFVYPVAQYDHDEGNAIGSGYVYEGQSIPELQGKYVFADIVRGRVFYMDTHNLIPGKPAAVNELRLSFNGEEKALADVTSIENSYVAGKRVDLRLGIDGLGELYLLTKSDGWVRKLVPHQQ
jgi:glucose/arabinose dehydrogenase